MVYPTPQYQHSDQCGKGIFSTSGQLKSAAGVYPTREEGFPCTATKILKTAINPTPNPKVTCNCQISKRADCPVPGAWNQDGAIYEAKVKDFQNTSRHEQTGTQMDQPHCTSMFGGKNDEGLNLDVIWKYLETIMPDFNPVTKTRKLCTREKFQILLNPAVATLNQKAEIFSSCRHRLPLLPSAQPKFVIYYFMFSFSMSSV
jgi:hypothetical protein